MKKAIFIITTVFIMLITSRFVIRIVDATVQIDNDIALLIILLIVLNVVIGMLESLPVQEEISREVLKESGRRMNRYPAIMADAAD